MYMRDHYSCLHCSLVKLCTSVWYIPNTSLWILEYSGMDGRKKHCLQLSRKKGSLGMKVVWVRGLLSVVNVSICMCPVCKALCKYLAMTS